MAAAFADWGTPTVEALADARAAAPGLPVIASGGVRDGVEVAKCLALGATAGGSPARCSSPPRPTARARRSRTIAEQLRIATWRRGAAPTRSAQHLAGRPA